MAGNYIVTRAFQYRGGMWRPGARLRLTEAEAAKAWVAAHVAPEGGKKDQMPYLGNGVLLPETPDARLMPRGRGKRTAAMAKGGLEGAEG